MSTYWMRVIVLITSHLWNWLLVACFLCNGGLRRCGLAQPMAHSWEAGGAAEWKWSLSLRRLKLNTSSVCSLQLQMQIFIVMWIVNKIKRSLLNGKRSPLPDIRGILIISSTACVLATQEPRLNCSMRSRSQPHYTHGLSSHHTAGVGSLLTASCLRCSLPWVPVLPQVNFLLSLQLSFFFFILQ